MSNDGCIRLQVSRRYQATAEQIFHAWLDPTHAGQWLFATPTGQMVRVEIDPRVGGSFVIVDRRPDGDAEHYGHYLELDRPSRLVFTFSVDKHSRDGDRVTVEILPQGGDCELTLTHEMDAKWADWVDQTLQGWKDILEGLARTLENR
ncbi:MAG: SRPBCC family protein [Bacillota bacterium]